MCSFSTNLPNVQDASPIFTLLFGITPSATIGCRVEVIFPDSLWIGQITPTGNVALTPINTPAITISNIQKSTTTLKITFDFSCTTPGMLFQLQFNGLTNAIYSQASYINCKLFDSSDTYSTSKASSPTNTISALSLASLTTSGSYGENTIGLVNIVDIAIDQNLNLYSTNQIILTNLNIQTGATVSSFTSLPGPVSISFTYVTDLVTPQITITLQQNIAKTTGSTLWIKVTNVQSSYVQVANTGNIAISTSSSQGIASGTFSWSPTTVATLDLTGGGVTANPLNTVGATNTAFYFKFYPAFPIDYTHQFTISQVVETWPTTTTNSVYIMNGFTTTGSCTTTGVSCSFGFSTGTMPTSTQIDLRWYSFTNYLSIRPVNFLLQVYSSTSKLMAQATFPLNVFTVSSITGINLDFTNKVGSYNTVSTTTSYTLTMTPSTTIQSVVIVKIYIPTGFTIPTNTVSDPICSSSSVTCSSQSSPSAIIYQMASGTSLTGGTSTSAISFNLKNPSCGGANSFSLTVDSFNYRAGDPTSMGYQTSSGTSASSISLTYVTASCSSTPFLYSVSSIIRSATSNYEFDFTGCGTPTLPSTSYILFTFPAAYQVSSITCSYTCNGVGGSLTMGTQCYVKTGTQIYINIPSINSCSSPMRFKISNVVNPNLSGPQDNFILEIWQSTCSVYYMSFDGLVNIITNTISTTNDPFYFYKFIPSSTINLATNSYTFQLQICFLCLIAQSSKVTAKLNLVWASGLTICSCTPSSSTMSITYTGPVSQTCSYTMGTNLLQNNLYTITLSNCVNPSSTKTPIKIDAFLYLQDISPGTQQYIGFSSSYTTYTDTAYTIILNSALTTNSPMYPSYLSTSSNFVLNHLISPLAGTISLTTSNMNYQTGGTLDLYDSSNILVKSVTATTGSTTIDFSASSIPTNFRITISNWVTNFASVSDSNIYNYGIKLNTFDTSGGAVGQIYLKPPVSCDFPCQTCVTGSTSQCLTCYGLDPGGGVYYKLCNKGCYISCNNAISNYICYESSSNTCSLCTNNCLTCNSDSNQCYSCQSGFSLSGTKCFQLSSFSEALSSGKIAPFPFLFATVALIFIAIIGYFRDSHSYLTTNILLSITPLLHFAYLIQFILGLVYSNGAYNFPFVLVGFLANVVLNIILAVKFCESIYPDQPYIKWVEIHIISIKFIKIFSYGFSFNVFRLFYSRFLGFDMFAIRLNTYDKYFQVMNIITIISTCVCFFPVIIGDIIGLVYVPWTNQLNITMIETLIISLLAIILSFLQLFHSRLSVDDLVGKKIEEPYSIEEQNPEHKKLVGNSLPYPMLKKGSWAKLPNNLSREELIELRPTKSCPPTPRTLKEIMDKFELYKVNTEQYPISQPYFDNIEFESRPTGSKPTLNPKQMQIQTTPFGKIGNFRRMIRKQDEEDRMLRNKLISPMEPIPEEPVNKPREFDEADLLGSFERDEEGAILIIQDRQGNLIDKHQRKVNEHGYLIDNNGNILTKNGELAFNKEEIDYADMSQINPNNQSNPDTNTSVNVNKPRKFTKKLRKAPEKKQKGLGRKKPEKINYPMPQEEGPDFSMNDADVYSNRSDPVDPMMEDKPSNYDELNMRNFAEEGLKNLNPQKNISNGINLTYPKNFQNNFGPKNSTINLPSKNTARGITNNKTVEGEDILKDLDIPQQKNFKNEDFKSSFNIPSSVDNNSNNKNILQNLNAPYNNSNNNPNIFNQRNPSRIVDPSHIEIENKSNSLNPSKNDNFENSMFKSYPNNKNYRNPINQTENLRNYNNNESYQDNQDQSNNEMLDSEGTYQKFSTQNKI